MRVLVLILRGLPLGYLGCYGNGWIDTPVLDRLAAEGIVFDQHIADCPNAAGARRAWRTGRFHFALDADPKDPLPDLMQMLHEQAIVTSLVLDDSRGAPLGWADGWNHIRRAAVEANVPTLECLLQAVGDALDEVIDADEWLMWVEFATPLPPWDLPAELREKYLHPTESEDDDEVEDESGKPLEPLAEPQPGILAEPQDEIFLRLQTTFAAAVSHVDAAIGILLDELDERGLAEDVTLIVTTDHGQALGEHGIVGPCRPWLHEELVHLPLLMRLPGGAEAGRRVAALTQPLDLFPTILEAFGCTPAPSHGTSLATLLQGGAAESRAYVVSALRDGEREEWALRTPKWALLLPVAAAPEDGARAPQLYIKPEDRWEVNNVVQHHLDTAEMLEKTLRSFVHAARQPGPLVIPALEAHQP
jgi:arylsulfatase A-like enzyme